MRVSLTDRQSSKLASKDSMDTNQIEDSADFTDYPGLALDFQELLFQPETSDLTLIVHGERLPVHRVILAARSPVFKAMLYGSMRESHAEEITVSTFEVEPVRSLLTFIYTGSLTDVPIAAQVPLMACADHYGMTGLKDLIHDSLEASISVEKACSVLSLAQYYQQQALYDLYIDFVMLHAPAVFRTRSFLDLDPGILMRILSSDVTRAQEVDLFHALISWIKKPDRVVKLDTLALLFDQIRFDQISGHDLVKHVKPHMDIIPQDLYIRALEHAAAPEVKEEKDSQTQSRRRLPPIGTIRVSEQSYLQCHSTVVVKTGPTGWNCTAVAEPSTNNTKIRVKNLVDVDNGLGIAVFEPDRVTFRGGYPNPNQWGADCLMGIYGTGCFFGTRADNIIQWQTNSLLQVVLQRLNPMLTQVQFFDSDGVLLVETRLSSGNLQIAIALYSPSDAVEIESVW